MGGAEAVRGPGEEPTSPVEAWVLLAVHQQPRELRQGAALRAHSLVQRARRLDGTVADGPPSSDAACHTLEFPEARSPPPSSLLHPSFLFLSGSPVSPSLLPYKKTACVFSTLLSSPEHSLLRRGRSTVLVPRVDILTAWEVM